jgi:hypothetical protein
MFLKVMQGLKLFVKVLDELDDILVIMLILVQVEQLVSVVNSNLKVFYLLK